MVRDLKAAVMAMRRQLDQLEQHLGAADQTANPIMKHVHLTEANNTATAINGVIEWLRLDIETERADLFGQITAKPEGADDGLPSS